MYAEKRPDAYITARGIIRNGYMSATTLCYAQLWCSVLLGMLLLIGAVAAD